MNRVIKFKNIFHFTSFASKMNNFGLSDDYEILRVLGKGSSARIFQGMNVVTGEKVVVKMFKKLPPESIKKQIQINHVLLKGINSTIKHAEFLHLLDTLYDHSSGTYTLIYQYFQGVPLNEIITVIQPQKALRTVLVMAHTLNYIHLLGLVHRDVKPANILITPKGPKLFDFGLAEMIDEQQGLQIKNFGTKCYKCPEVIYRMNLYNQSVDVWGLGLIFAEMILNKRHILQYENDLLMLSQISSFCGLTEEDKCLIPAQILQNVKINKGKSWDSLANSKQIDPRIISLVKRMIQINPAKRPSLDQVIRNPIFSQIVI